MRRLAKDNVMANRRNVNGLSPVDLGFSSDTDVSHINLYDHLTPRLQELLYESKRSKMPNPTSIAGRRMVSSFCGRQIALLYSIFITQLYLIALRTNRNA